MTYKRTPTDDEIEALSQQLKPLWRAGDAVRPWLRKHATTLVDLVHDDWSWAGVAAALDRAGIAYRTGNPWQAEQLRAKIAGTRRPLKRDGTLAAKGSVADERIAEMGNLEPMSIQDFNSADANISASHSTIQDEEPEFKFVKLSNWSGNTTPPARQMRAKEAVQQISASEVDAIVARLTGGKSS